MAYSIAALVKVVTATTGTNNYVLSDPASPGPTRTDVQAVDDGSLTNGQTIHYMVRDTTVLGDASFEEGIGVYTSATRTVARSAGNVIDGSNGPGVLVTWGGSGQRDFYVLRALDGEDVRSAANFAANLGLPTLAAVTNTYGGFQVFSRSVPSAQYKGLTVNNSAAANAANEATLDLICKTTAQDRSAGIITANLTDVTDATRTGRIRFGVFSSGSFSWPLVVTGTGLLDVSGNKHDAFPAGQVLLSESVPVGWVRLNETNQATVRLATSADTPGAGGGSDSLFDGAWATDQHVLTIAQMPNHAHGRGYVVGSVVSVGSGGGSLHHSQHWGDHAAFANSEPIGGGGSHTHPMFTPFYRVLVRIQKS